MGPSEVHWLSRELYALQERPLWPPAPNATAYRLTVIPAFSSPQSVTLTVQPNNAPQIRFREANRARRGLVADVVGTVSARQLADFSESLNRIQFWQLPTESAQPGFDGADWILEAVQDGRYHVVLRWCPGSTPFGEAAVRLFEVAGHRLGGC